MIVIRYENGGGDIVRAPLIQSRDDLETAVILSLFLDARADGERGWWAGGIGSLLWKLFPGKQTEERRADAERYAQDALAWLTEAGVAQSVTAAAIYPERDVLGLVIEIKRPDGTGAAYTYALNWAAQAARGGINGVE